MLKNCLVAFCCAWILMITACGGGGGGGSSKSKDAIPPVITLNGLSEIVLGLGDPYIEYDAVANDNLDGDVPVGISGFVDVNTIGVYKITYTAVDTHLNQSTVIRTVTVVDDIPPVITLNGSSSIKLEVGSPYIEEFATAVDGVDGVVAVSLSGAVDVNVIGYYKITYTAIDNAGNISTRLRTVQIADTTPPVITLNGSSLVRHPSGVVYEDLGAKAMDSVDGEVPVIVTGTVNYNSIGTFTITYTATDKSKNNAVVTRKVEVSLVQTGYFIGPPIAGVKYSTGSHTGYTNSLGQFQYLQGEEVTFSIGNLVLGSAQAGPMVTPLSLLGESSIEQMSDAVINIAQLLQSLDMAPGNDGITKIPSGLENLSANHLLTGSDAELINILNEAAGLTGAAYSLVSEAAAEQELKHYLTLAAQYERIFSLTSVVGNDPAEYFLLTLPEDSSVLFSADCLAVTTYHTSCLYLYDAHLNPHLFPDTGSNKISVGVIYSLPAGNYIVKYEQDLFDNEIVVNIVPKADSSIPVLSVLSPVVTPTMDTTPSFSFNSSEAGSISYSGGCSSPTAVASSGGNTITFNVLAYGTYSNCSVRVTDAAGNASAWLTVPSFVITNPAIEAPVISVFSAIDTPTNLTMPVLVFSSTEAGTISYFGSCSSWMTAASAGINTITLNELGEGNYADCSIKVTDSSGNVSNLLEIPDFEVDTTDPVISLVTGVPTPTDDSTPSFVISSSETVFLSYAGSCSSAVTVVSSGATTITFSPLSNGTYSDCILQGSDLAGNSMQLAVNTFTISGVVFIPRQINDTGVVTCGDYAYGYSENHNFDLNCADVGSTQTTAGTDGDGDPVPAGQDAVFGRDSDPATNSDEDGWKGFSYTKLKSDGTALSVQNGTWSDAGSEATGTKWSCVKDNVTGLVWEVKTNDGGLRDKDWQYTWFNSTGVNDGGDWGIGDTGLASTTGYETYSGVYTGSDNCYNTSRCDAEKYTADVNASNLCGASEWRLPSVGELKTLRYLRAYGLAIDASFIPNTVASAYWTASPTASPILRDGAWIVNFVGGYDDWWSKDFSFHIRLVRGSP
jgi:hypothetical protein